MTVLRLLACFCAMGIATGCDDLTDMIPDPPAAYERPDYGIHHDPQHTGTIAGVVRWQGDRPIVHNPPIPHVTSKGIRWAEVANPNTPRIDSELGLGQAVVWLDGIDVQKAAPWGNQDAVQVTVDEDSISIDPDRRIGFVRVGDAVTFQNTSPNLLGVRARGAAYFTQMLPDQGRTQRTMSQPGRVELTSPANIHWAIADIIVCEHPYYTQTDDQGRFTFTQVPPGSYTLVTWVPHWQITEHDRDPESGVIFRSRYAAPREFRQSVTIVDQSTTQVEVTVPASAFTLP